MLQRLVKCTLPIICWVLIYKWQIYIYICIYIYMYIYIYRYVYIYICVFYNYTHIDNTWDEAVYLQHTALSGVCFISVSPSHLTSRITRGLPGGLKVHVLSNKCEESKDLLFGPLSRGAAALRGWGPNFWGKAGWQSPMLCHEKTQVCCLHPIAAIFWLLVFFWASALAIIPREIPICWTHTDTI